MSDFDVDTLIDRLLEVRGSKPGKPVPLTENEIKDLCYSSLREAGASELQATTAAQELMDAEAEGIRNVGLGYLPHYLNHLLSLLPSLIKASPPKSLD